MSVEDTREMFRHAAHLLAGGDRTDPEGGSAAALLDALGYGRSVADSVDRSGAETAHRAKLLMAAARFPRLFQLDSDSAPGLVFFGAELATPTVLSASGVGLTFRAGFEGCVGEGIELSSQFHEINEKLTPVVAPGGARWDPSLFHPGLPPETPTDWLPAVRLVSDGLAAPAGNDSRAAGMESVSPLAAMRMMGGDPSTAEAPGITHGAVVSVPADMVVRRGPQRKLLAPYPLSIGCGAGRSLAAATLHGLLESIERDAAALWWRGGRRGRMLPLDGPAMVHAARVLAAIRQGSRRRRSWLLDITSDLGVPCVAAVSVDPDGFGFACGVAARMTLWAASQAAIQEMCQMELARAVVAAKREERGEAGLNAFDIAHDRRAREVNAAGCVLLHPLPPRDPGLGAEAIIGWDESPDSPVPDPARAVGMLVQRLEARGIEAAMVDLTRPEFGVPVVRVLCPGLEKEPSTQMGPRLLAAIAETGGGGGHTHDVPLM